MRASGSAELAPGTRRGASVEPGVGVEDAALVRGPCQASLLELAAHRDHRLCRGSDILSGGTAAPRIRTCTAVGEDPPGEDEPVLAVRPQIRE